MQLSQINVAGQLKKTVDLTPFSVDTTFIALTDEKAFKGPTTTSSRRPWQRRHPRRLGRRCHGGAEAMAESYTQTQIPGSRSRPGPHRLRHPYNPGDALRFNPIDPCYSRRSPACPARTGNSLSTKEFNRCGRSCSTRTHDLHRQPASARSGRVKEFFLNFDSFDVGAPLDTEVGTSTAPCKKRRR